MNTITFVVAEKNSPDGRYPFTVLRMSDRRQDVVSYHATMDDATEAARRYALQARFSGLKTRIFEPAWLATG